MSLMRFAAQVSTVSLLLTSQLLTTSIAYGQTYPNKPIRIVTGTAGGSSDFSARLVAQGIAGPLGEPVIVENQSNANIAIEISAKSPPDGYTLHFNGNTLWTTPLLQKVNYEVNDFAPVTQVTRDVSVFAVHPSLPVQSIRELIAYAKTKPGDLNYASGATGGTVHLGFELFKQMAGVNIVRVPYKGPAPAVTAVMSGEVQMTINNVALIMTNAKTGKLKALAVTSATPSALVPGLPTVAASGLPGYELVGLNGIFVPAKTPRALINRLNQEIVRVINTPDVKGKLFDVGNEVVGNTPEEFAAAMKADVTRVAKVIKDANIKIDQ